MMHLKLCTPTHHRATDQSFGPVTVALMATEKQSEASEATRPTVVKEFVFDDDGHYYVDLSKDPMRSMIEEDELEGDPSSDQLSNSTTGDSSSDSDDDHQATDQSLGSVTVALMATETKSDASEATKPTVAKEFVFDDDGHYDVGMIEEDDQFVVLMQSMIEEDEPEGGSPSVQLSGSTEYKASPYNVEVGKDTMRAQLDKARKPTCATAMQASNVADYYMTKYLSKAQEALGPVPRLFIRTSFNNLGESRWTVHRMLQLAGRPTHRCLECLSRLTTMKRFHDETLVSILQKMRQSGGCILTREEKKALRNTDVSKKTAEEQRRRLANTELCRFHLVPRPPLKIEGGTEAMLADNGNRYGKTLTPRHHPFRSPSPQLLQLPEAQRRGFAHVHYLQTVRVGDYIHKYCSINSSRPLVDEYCTIYASKLGVPSWLHDGLIKDAD